MYFILSSGTSLWSTVLGCLFLSAFNISYQPFNIVTVHCLPPHYSQDKLACLLRSNIALRDNNTQNKYILYVQIIKFSFLSFLIPTNVVIDESESLRLSILCFSLLPNEFTWAIGVIMVFVFHACREWIVREQKNQTYASNRESLFTVTSIRDI